MKEPARGAGDDGGVVVVRAGGVTPTPGATEKVLRNEGLTPTAWGNGAGFSYARHRHGHHKVLVCVSGSIVFHTDTGDVTLEPGDRMELSAGIEHGATVGPDGVECVEAYRP